MGELMNKMMLSCKKATQLVEKKWVVKLTLQENLQLKLHTTMCSACKEYQKKSRIIEKALERMNTKKNKIIGLNILIDIVLIFWPVINYF